MNTWSKEINLDDYAECKEFRIHYYTRRMNGGYNSHLFLVNWDSEEQLLKGWNQIDSFVAVNIQSQTELLIERSNFYIIHFVKKTVMKEIKRGMKNGIPIALGYLSVSFSFGAIAVSMGFSVMQSVLISLFNLTSAGQFASLGIIAGQGKLGEGVSDTEKPAFRR